MQQQHDNEHDNGLENKLTPSPVACNFTLPVLLRQTTASLSPPSNNARFVSIRRLLILACTLLLALISPSFPSPSFLSFVSADIPTIKALWFDWPPCHNLQALGQQFPGTAIHFNVTCVDIADWYTASFDDLRNNHEYDLLVLDSQYVGEAVEGGLG